MSAYCLKVSGHFPEKWRHFVFPKRFCALGLGLELELGLVSELGLRLQLAEVRFQLNVYSGKCTRSVPYAIPNYRPILG